MTEYVFYISSKGLYAIREEKMLYLCGLWRFANIYYFTYREETDLGGKGYADLSNESKRG